MSNAFLTSLLVPMYPFDASSAVFSRDKIQKIEGLVTRTGVAPIGKINGAGAQSYYKGRTHTYYLGAPTDMFKTGAKTC